MNKLKSFTSNYNFKSFTMNQLEIFGDPASSLNKEFYACEINPKS